MLTNQRAFNLVRDLTSSLIMIIRKPTHFTLFNYHWTDPNFSIGNFTSQFQSFLIFYVLPSKIDQVHVVPWDKRHFFIWSYKLPFLIISRCWKKTLPVCPFLKSGLFYFQIKSFTHKWQFCCVSITLTLQDIFPHDSYICPLLCITLLQNIL